MIHYRTAGTGGHRVFYREAGEPENPAVLLLHGFPTSSHMFRDLIPLLADRYHVVAPDLPGFGNTVSPPRGQFDYTPVGAAPNLPLLQSPEEPPVVKEQLVPFVDIPGLE
jgi:pimeloyl-ACP methyl ester carboxylesterase